MIRKIAAFSWKQEIGKFRYKKTRKKSSYPSFIIKAEG